MNSAPRMKYSVSLFFLALLFSTESMAMLNYCLFSEVRGVVVSDGKPVANATIERTYRWRWKNSEGQDNTSTNEKGEFQLPELTGFALTAWLPHEPYINQTIRIKVQGVSYDAWMYSKRDYDKNGELDGKPMVLYCSLQTPVRTFSVDDNFSRTAAGICELR